MTQQECIPVGCVPAERRPYAGVCFPGGGVCSGGVLHAGGEVVSGPEGGSPCRGGRGWWCLVRGVCSGGVLHAGGGVSAPGGFSMPGGFSLPDPPPVNRMTNRCNNITLAKTSFRPVNMGQNVCVPDNNN